MAIFLPVHIYMAALAPGEGPALRSMFTGYVPESHVQHHKSALVRGPEKKTNKSPASIARRRESRVVCSPVPGRKNLPGTLFPKAFRRKSRA